MIQTAARGRVKVLVATRLAAVAAVGVAVVGGLNATDPIGVSAITSDVIAFVGDHVQTQAQTSLELMAIGRDIFAHVWGL